MTSSARFLIITLALALILISCENPGTIDTQLSKSYSLVDSDSTSVDFPNDFKGQISVITFIFTNCPDVCPIITANMTNIQKELQDTSGINFIEISFDPERDKPSVLKDYKDLYQLNEQFSLLTGDTATINSLLDDLEIVAEKTIVDSLGHDSSNYAMRHSNTIYLMDKDGYIRAEYPAHRIPPEHVTEDIQILYKE
jgi:protein SCO1/2